MTRSRLILASTCLAALFSLAQCSAPTSDPPPTGMGGTSSPTGGTTGAAGMQGTAGTTASTAGTNGAAGTVSLGGSNGTAGTTGGRGGTTGAAGTQGAGGSTAAAGRGGTTGAAGTAAAGRGGTTGVAGTTGAAGRGGTTGAAGSRVDQGGVPLAMTGSQNSASRGYLNLGDMRLINNRWGSDELGCTGTTQRVYINVDRSLGWDFNRPACGGAKGKPDYPEVEFGVAPFGATSTLLTTPAFSSTTLLPRQIKDITSASIQVDNMRITFGRPTYYNMNFEVWLSMRNPLTDPNPGVFAEIIAFWGFEASRLTPNVGWPCPALELSKPQLTSGTHSYYLCHQSDTWANGQWRFYNFNVNGGPLTTYNGTVDVKAFLDWVVTNYGISRDLWVTRIEVGSEIDDNTQGTVRINNLTFQVNGTSKSVELAN